MLRGANGFYLLEISAGSSTRDWYPNRKSTFSATLHNCMKIKGLWWQFFKCKTLFMGLLENGLETRPRGILACTLTRGQCQKPARWLAPFTLGVHAPLVRSSSHPWTSLPLVTNNLHDWVTPLPSRELYLMTAHSCVLYAAANQCSKPSSAYVKHYNRLEPTGTWRTKNNETQMDCQIHCSCEKAVPLNTTKF